jgi:uncharacterized protein (UPF0276 family)
MPPPRFGVGFRTPHGEEILAAPRSLDWLEVLSDNHLGVGGPRRKRLERLRADHPLALHGTSLSIAGTEPLSLDYLRALAELADALEPVAVSDHLCWTALSGHQSHDLLPVACTREVLEHVAERVARVQDALGRRLLLENASAYVAFRGAELTEAELLAELCRRTGCGVLLDVNNLYVNAQNLGIDAAQALAELPPEVVGYMHLAGHAVLPDVRIDTHDAEVPSPVWELFEAAARRFPDADVVIERDDRIPPLAELLAELACARERHAKALAAPSAPGARAPAPPAVRAAAETAPAPPRWGELQRAFFERLVDKPAGFDHAADPDLGALLEDGRPVRAARGMRVYSDAYGTNLRRALETNFPALARVISPRDFGGLAAAYLRHHPPRGHDYVRLGVRLAGFVRAHEFGGDYGVARGALAELVELEQAQLEVQDAPDDDAALAPRDLAAIPPEDWAGARFDFVRALAIVCAEHDVLAVVQAVARGESPARPAPGHVVYLVYRTAGGVRTERIAPAEARALEALRAGAAFAEACAALAEGGGLAESAERGARLLVDACARGLVRGVPGRS